MMSRSTMTNAEAEQLVAAGRARWFNDDQVAESFANEHGGEFIGEINRVSTYRFLVVLGSTS